MSQFATALSWVPMSRNLAATMERACAYASQQAHRQVTLEHLLLALTDDADAGPVMTVSNVDLAQLGADVAGHVSRNDNRYQPHEVIDPTADETLVRILDYAAAAARQSRRREINGAVVLAAVIGDGSSTAATLLKSQGLTFEAAIKALQRSSAQAKAPPAEPQVAAAVAVVAPTPAPVAPEPAVAPPPEVPAAEAAPGYGAPPHANEAMLANVRRKLEATRANAPARPVMAPIAPLVPAPAAPPPVPPTPAATAAAPAESLSTINTVDESTGLAALTKVVVPSAVRPTPPVPPELVRAAGQDSLTPPPSSPPPMPPMPPVVPTSSALPERATHSIGADLAKTHDGWLPPSTPTLVTEAKPTRRPSAEKRNPEPATLELAGVGPSDWPPRDGPANPAPRDDRVAQDAGPPRPTGRMPAAAPWPDSVPPPVPRPAPPGPRPEAYAEVTAPPRQTSVREFQPLPTGALAGPSGMPHLPPSQLPGQPIGPAIGHMPMGTNAVQPQPHGMNRLGAGPGPSMPVQGMPQQSFPAQGMPLQSQQTPLTQPQHIGSRPASPPNGQKPPRPAVIAATIGKLTAPIPTKWRVARTEQVEIRLSPEDLRSFAAQLDGRGGAYTHDKIVAKALSVRLRAANHSFAVEPTAPETLWLDTQTLQMSNDGAHWRWHATPQTSGKKKLQLLISARTVGADGVVAETALPDQTVTVKVGHNLGRLALKLLGYLAAIAIGAALARYGEGGIETILAWKRGFQ